MADVEVDDLLFGSVEKAHAGTVLSELVDAGEADGYPRLVLDVQLKQHSSKRFDGGRVGKFAGIERANVRDALDDLDSGRSGRRVIGADENVAFDRMVQSAEATEPRGGTSGWNSWATLASAFAIEITTLPWS